MKLLFVNSAYPKECYSQLNRDAQCFLQVPSDVFQWAFIDGLERCGIDYTLACTPALPAWPRYQRFFTPSGEMKVDENVRGHYLRYCAAPVLNQKSWKSALKSYILNWCKANANEDKLIVICYTQQADRLGAAVALKKYFPNLVVAPIVTDLIDNAMDFAANRTFAKRIQVKLEERAERRLFPKVDKFVLLTRQMTECIPEAVDKYIVMEGIASWDSIAPRDPLTKSEDIRSLLYAGTFQEFGGLRMLVDAFLKTKDPRFRLVLCGQGVLKDYVEKASSADSRIIYKGLVSHEDVVRLQRESTILINPRRPNGGITKYSFPSKTMEYMSSLTPMMGYHLEGIPEEYYAYMFTPKDLTQEALTDCINNTLSLPLDLLQKKANEAFRFVAHNKNSIEQVRRIIEFLI